MGGDCVEAVERDELLPLGDDGDCGKRRFQQPLEIGRGKLGERIGEKRESLHVVVYVETLASHLADKPENLSVEVYGVEARMGKKLVFVGCNLEVYRFHRLGSFKSGFRLDAERDGSRSAGASLGGVAHGLNPALAEKHVCAVEVGAGEGIWPDFRRLVGDAQRFQLGELGAGLHEGKCDGVELAHHLGTLNAAVAALGNVPVVAFLGNDDIAVEVRERDALDGNVDHGVVVCSKHFLAS